MKKLLGLFVVLALAMPASADVLKNVDIVGEIETIASDVHHNLGNRNGTYYNQATNTRVLAGLSANLVEDVTANVLFQYVTAWDGEMAGDNISNYEETVELANANVVLSNLFDCFEATIGRQFYGDEDSAVMYIGPNHYNAENFRNAPSLDAVKLTYADDVKALTLIAGKFPRYMNFNGSNDNGTNLFGADVRFNVTDAVKVQGYIYDFRNVSVFNLWDYDGEDDAHAGLYGAKLAFNPENVLASVEYARNFGGHRLIKEHKDTGYMLKADAAMNVEAVKVRAAFLYETENFMAMGNYTPGLLIGHVLGSRINRYSWGEGVRMYNLGADYNITDKWTVALDGYSFQDRYGHHASTWEADLTASYKHNQYVELFAGLGYAKYAEEPAGYKTDFHKDNYKWQLGMLINF